MSVVHIDLSAKVKQWSKDSAIAICNDIERVCLVTTRNRNGFSVSNSFSVMARSHSHSAFWLCWSILRYERRCVLSARLSLTRAIRAAKPKQPSRICYWICYAKNVRIFTSGFIRFANIAGHNADRFTRDISGKTQSGERNNDGRNRGAGSGERD